ncbi:MAG: hypothetical protein GX902_01325 [Lentisphaerae bacterium]|nr:hypothetical protein [Lentisphaerota bacterium]
MLKHLLLSCLAALSLSAAAAELILNLQPIVSPDRPQVIDLQANLRQVVIPRLNAPALDGSDRGWEKAFRDKGFTIIRDKAITRAKGMQATGDWESFLAAALRPTQDSALALGYDDQFLYLQVDCFEQAMDKLVGYPNAERDANIYGGDCVDLTFSKNRNSPAYVQIVIDCNGNRFDTMNTRKSDSDSKKGKNSFTSDKSWNPEYPVAVVKSDKSWRMVTALPFAECGIQAKDGDFVDINVCRNEMPSRELSSWGPTEFGFHEADKMVRLWLGQQNSPAVFLSQLSYLTPRIGTNILNLKINNTSDKPFSGEIELTLKQGKDSKSFRDKVAVAAGRNHSFPLHWEALKPGPYIISVILFEGEAPLGMGSLSTVVPEPMSVSLSKRTFFSHTRRIPASVQLAVTEPEAYALRLSLSQDGKKLQDGGIEKLTTREYRFSIDVTAVKEKADLLVELVSRADGTVQASENISLSCYADPFAEP